MRPDHVFWAVLLVAALVWYAAVTIYVAIRGTRDIRDLTRRLGDPRSERSDESAHENRR